jgi:prepilin-type processing-associated H-X9-DG protein
MKSLHPREIHRSAGLWRAGFTIVEMVVVLGIVALATALLLAAVQKARDAAARASCASRLRQLTIGTHTYAGSFQLLPQGCAYPHASTSREVDNHSGISWQTALLPYLEQRRLWQQAVEAHRADPTGETPPHGRVVETVVRQFLCPSEGRTKGTDGKHQWALTSYLGVAGTAAKRDDGIFHRNFRVRLADITDGTSSTLMIGERPPGPNGAYSSWYAGWGDTTCSVSQLLPAGRFAIHLAHKGDCPRPRPSLYLGQLDDECATGHFWSLHAGGTHFAFADGSVRFIRYSATELLPALATRAGGETIAVPD